MRSFLAVLLVCIVLPLFSGCALIKEFPKKIWGSSTVALEKARKDGVSYILDLDYKASFNRVLDVLKDMECCVYVKDKRKYLIVAMNFQGESDTTELGIFFIEKTPYSTEIQLSSLSSSLLNYAAKEIFSRLNSK